jgi:hypothetical protein
MENFHGLFEVQIKKDRGFGLPAVLEIVFVIRCLVKLQGQTRCFGFATTTSDLNQLCKFDICVCQFSYGSPDLIKNLPLFRNICQDFLLLKILAE